MVSSLQDNGCLSTATALLQKIADETPAAGLFPAEPGTRRPAVLSTSRAVRFDVPSPSFCSICDFYSKANPRQ